MQQIIQFINSVPEFMWTNIFTVINTLICGLIVAVFTSTFLKRKEERTRIAGVIVEKRMNSEQEILHFLEHVLFKEEINIENSSKYDVIFSELLDRYRLPDPHDGHIQYARIFTSQQSFEQFFHEFEDQIMTHKLWLDTRVRTHLVFMQLYFGFFITIPLMVKRIPLPKGKELTDEQFLKVCEKVLFVLGVSCDGEINAFMSELDEKIVDSVYKLELSRPRKSIMRDNMYNVDIQKCMRRIERKTIVGIYQKNIFHLIMGLVYQTAGIDEEKMTDEEYDAFLKSAMPQEHEEMQQELHAFQEAVQKAAEESGVKIVNRKDLDKYPGMYGMSLKEALEEKEPKKM